MNLTIDKTSGLPILMIDASALKTSGCMRRLWFTAVEGVKPRESAPKIAMEFGIAFHKFCQEFHDTGKVEVGMKNALDYYQKLDISFGEKEYRTPEKLLQTCFGYAAEYKFDNFQILRNAATGEALVEQKFAIEYPGFETLGFHVLLVGTIDAIGTLNGNELVIMDHKTTSVWDKENYLDAYKASPQLKFYKLVLQRYAELYPSTFGQFREAGTMINGIFLAKAGDAKFKRSQVYNFTEENMKEFEVLLHQKITELCLVSLKSVGLPAATGKIHDLCNSAFGLCPYFHGCNLPSESDTQDWLETNCERKQYDPRTFGGV